MSVVPRVAILRLVGEFDMSTRAQLQRLFLSLTRADYAVLDMEDVTFCDSTVLTALVRLRRRMSTASKSDALRIARPSRAVRRALEVTCLDQIFAVYDTIQEAIGELPHEPSVITFVGTGVSELTAAADEGAARDLVV